MMFIPSIQLFSQPMPDEMDSPVPNLPTPSQDEQQRMAEFWAAEESREPRTWENDQELDYSEIAKNRGAAEQDFNSSKNSGAWLMLFIYS